MKAYNAPDREMSKSLDKLEELSPHLESLIASSKGNVTEYKTVEGLTVVGFGLWKNGNASVQRAIVPDGATLPWHHHPKSREIIVVIEGYLRFTTGDAETSTMVGPQGFIVLEPGEKHKAQAVGGEAHCVAVAVPSDEGFPDAIRRPEERF